MGALFGKPSGGHGPAGKKPVITKRDEAILQLKLQTDNLRKYQSRLELVVQKETEAARTLALAGKQRQAMLALKKKKYQESLIHKTDAMLLNLQQMISTIQFKEIEIQVMSGLQAGTECLKELHKELSVDDVERILADTEDAIAYQHEIEAAMGSKLTAADEADVERELAELEAQVAAEKLPEVPTTPLPQAPTAATARRQPAKVLL